MSRNPSVLCRNTGIWQLVSLTLVLNVHFCAGEKGLGQPVHNQAAPHLYTWVYKNKKTKPIETQPLLPPARENPQTPQKQPQEGWVAAGVVLCWQGSGRAPCSLCLQLCPAAVLLLRDSSVLAACPAHPPRSGAAAGGSAELMPLQTAVRNCRYIMASA